MKPEQIDEYADKLKYASKLKTEFTSSDEYQGYDADEDHGYFIEWLIGRLFLLEHREGELDA